MEVLGQAAAELHLKKRTHIGETTHDNPTPPFYLPIFLPSSSCSFVAGVDLQFEWDESEAFIKQSDGSLFSWCERFRCYNHMIYGIVSSYLLFHIFTISR